MVIRMARKRGSRSRKSSTGRSRGSRSRSRRRSRSGSGSVASTVLKGLSFTAKLVTKGIKAVASRGSKKPSRYDDRCREVEEAILERARKEGLEGDVPPYVLKEACTRYLEGEDLDTVVKEAVEWWEETEAYRRSLD